MTDGHLSGILRNSTSSLQADIDYLCMSTKAVSNIPLTLTHHFFASIISITLNFSEQFHF